MKVNVPNGSFRSFRNQGSKALRKVYGKLQNEMNSRRDNCVFYEEFLDVKFIREYFATYLNYAVGTCITYGDSKKEIIEQIKGVSEDNKQLSNLFENFARGVKLDSNICFKNDSLFFRDESKTYTFSEFFDNDFYRALYTWATSLVIGLGSIYNGSITLESIIKSVIANCNITASDFDFTNFTRENSVLDEAFTFAATLYEKVPVDVPLYGSLSEIYSIGICSEVFYGLVMIAFYHGRIKGLVKTMYEYALYFPACANELRRYFFNESNMEKRRNAYSKFGIADTSTYALAKGVSCLYNFYKVVSPEMKLFDKSFVEYCNTLSADMYSEFEKAHEGVDFVDSCDVDDKIIALNGKDAFYSWEVTKNKLYGSLRYLLTWENRLTRDNEDMTRVISISDAILDACISANSGCIRDNFKRVNLKSKKETTDDCATDDDRPGCVSYDLMNMLHFRVMSAYDNLFAAYTYITPTSKMNEYQAELANKDSKIKSLEGNLEKVKNKNKKLSDEKVKYREEISEVKKSAAERVMKETESLRKKVDELNEYISSMESMLEVTSNKLMDKTKECSKLLKDNKKLQSQPAVTEEGVSQEETPKVEVTFEEKVAFLQKYHFIIAAGEPNFDRRLQDVGITNFTWFNEFKDKRNKAKFDYIVICTHNCPHRLVYWAQCLDRTNSKTLYFNSTGAKAFVEQMYNELA